MSSEWRDDLSKATEQVGLLNKYSVRFIDAEKFITHMTQLERHLQSYEQILLIGHFDTAFSALLDKKLQKYPGCKMKVISHRFGVKDVESPNRRGLAAMARAGVSIKVNSDVHARMFIGYHSKPDVSELIIGSFDFNSHGLSLYKKNAGIITKHPDLLRSAIKFFNDIWESEGTLTLSDYLNR